MKNPSDMNTSPSTQALIWFTGTVSAPEWWDLTSDFGGTCKGKSIFSAWYMEDDNFKNLHYLFGE